MRNLKLSFQHREVTTMKQITNKEYEEWQKYKAEKANGHILLPDTVRFICEANSYQYQKKEYTTSSQSTLDGWTLYDSSYTWGDYGPFGEWTDLGNGVVVEEGQKIERRTVYRYYYFLCNSCGAHMHGYGTCYKWAGGCGGKTYASDYYVVWSEKSYSESGDWHGTGVNYVYTDEGLGFAYISTASKYYEQPKEQYRIASRQKLYTYSFYRYGTPYWSESQVSSDNVKLVSTRLLYRYRLR